MSVEDSLLTLKSNLDVSNNLGDLIVNCLIDVILAFLRV